MASVKKEPISIVQLTRYLDEALAEPDAVLRERVEALRDRCLKSFSDEIIAATPAEETDQ